MGPHDPHSPDGLAAAFARGISAAFGADAKLIVTTPLAGDASSRRYFRLALGGPDGLPRSVVAMVLGADTLPLSSAELTIFETPPTELPYINVGRFLARIGIRIPQLHHHDERAGVLILEDVGDCTLYGAASGADGTRVLGFFRAAIDQLVRIQVLGTRDPDPTCVAFQQRFDARLFAWEFDHFLEHGLGPGSEGEAERLRAAFQPAIARLAGAPALLAHRDFHGWNLHVQDGAIRVLDFQDALLAPGTYDLASLLTDRNTGTVIDPRRERVLLEYYVEARRRLGGRDEDIPDVQTQYWLCVLQRALKVIGRFRYLERVKGKAGYLRYLPHVAAQAARACETSPDLRALGVALEPHLSACMP